MAQSVESPVCPTCAQGRGQQTWLLVGTVAIVGVVSVVAFGFRGGKAEAGSDQGQASQWGERLRDKDFDARQAAAKELLALGKDARPYASEIEAAVKDAAWDFATTVLPELGTNAEATFQIVGSTIKPPTPEELRQQEARRKERERKERELTAKAEKWTGYIVTLLKALDAADPERMRAINGQVVVQLLSETKQSTNTFQSVGPTILPAPEDQEKK